MPEPFTPDSPLDAAIADASMKALSAYEAERKIVEARKADRAADAARIAEMDAEVAELNQRLLDVTPERLTMLQNVSDKVEETRLLLQGSLDASDTPSS